MIKRYINRWSAVLVISVFMASSCQSEMDNLVQEGDETINSGLAQNGYFQAEFSFGSGNGQSRAAIKGESKLVQSLKYIIYKKTGDTYIYVSEKDVISYNGAVIGHTWPMTGIQTTWLEPGDYKVVFVGNVDTKLFNQTENILTEYKGDYMEARINMPYGGPQAFNENNMFYLAEAEFSSAKPKVDNILLQRTVSRHVVGRDFIEVNNAVSGLVSSLASEIKESQLTTDLVRGLLHSALLDPIDKALGGTIGHIVGGVTTVVDRLVGLLLGDLVNMLNEMLLKQLLERVEASLGGLGGGEGLLGLGYILNPWTTVQSVDVTVDMPSAMNFQRIPVKYVRDVEYKGVPVIKDYKNDCTFSMVTMNGDFKLNSAVVDYENNSLLGPVVSNLDEKLLAGLLINLKTPLDYRSQSNHQYTTKYDFLNLALRDNSPAKDEEKRYLELSLFLSEVLDAELLTQAILGDSALGNLLGDLVNEIVQPLLRVLGETTLALKIEIPDLGIDNIKIDGRWGATHLYDGTVVRN